jgi:hypothetical protein
MRFAAGCALAFATATLAAQPGANPDDLYRRVRERVLSDIVRLPNYTCVQTITRSVRGAMQAARSRPQLCEQIIREHNADKSKQSISSWDRLRIDVAIAEKHEVYSWVGADQFEKDNLHELVGEGQTSMGDFGSLILSIFSDHPTMQFQGERKSGARRLFEYSYETSEALSHYQVKVSFVQFTTAYSGSVFLDPEKTDVVRVTAHSAQLPEQTGYCQSVRELDYGREHIRSDEALIPREARVWVVNPDGVEMLNVNSYSNCHEYVGESVLRFDDPDNVTPAGGVSLNSPAKGRPPVVMPPGLRFDCRIVTPIDSETAAMGDPIEAVLSSSITDANGGIRAPAGAHIRGRLMAFAVRPGKQGLKDAYEIGVQFRWIELGGVRVPFAASLADTSGSKGLVRLNLRPGVGLFVFNEKRVHLDHLDAKWVTMSDPGRK